MSCFHALLQYEWLHGILYSFVTDLRLQNSSCRLPRQGQLTALVIGFRE